MMEATLWPQFWLLCLLRPLPNFFPTLLPVRARESRLAAEALALLGVIQALNGDIYGMIGGCDWSEMRLRTCCRLRQIEGHVRVILSAWNIANPAL